jgi:hypothetical protein
MTADGGRIRATQMGKPDEVDGRRARSYKAVLVDADGNETEDPAQAVSRELVESDGAARPTRRTWFFSSEAEVKWLPVGEAAFLLWVLALLIGVWLAIGFALGLI